MDIVDADDAATAALEAALAAQRERLGELEAALAAQREKQAGDGTAALRARLRELDATVHAERDAWRVGAAHYRP